MFYEVTGDTNVKKHLGSTAALVVGVISLVSGLANPGALIVAGQIIILGALAYRSAKNDGLVKRSNLCCVNLWKPLLWLVLLPLSCFRTI